MMIITTIMMMINDDDNKTNHTLNSFLINFVHSEK